MRNLGNWEAILLASQMGFVFAAAVVLGLLAGSYLDSVTNMSPVFIILGALAGTAAGITSSVQIVKYMQGRRNGRSE